ncbi:GNAT family N-acetyltransferase [Shewanella corallii]|uniref:GNAT family N-acetyltransferase n=1 Tax=Shewanella corallii TaxID=560080 RepID=A0ABT0N6Z5_9GAMM|nr:GNAT family N-acetyltransferase [Shewanella corallii]MCL2913651.1 GNAT family N-acetyltransferase [Shewanella corallii]
MQIRSIQASDWEAIMTIQSDTYHAFEPEPLEVMQSKWLLSPESCLVVEVNGHIVGYCLAHPWQGEPPSLNQSVPASIPAADTLYLHDMAFAAAARGLGAGKMVLACLVEYARSQSLPNLSLVAVQGANGYWEKQGFEHADTTKCLGTYCDNPSYMRLVL